MLEVEQSMLQDHEHEDGGHTHPCSASSVAEPHTHEYRNNPDIQQGYAGGNAFVADQVQATNQVTLASDVLITTTCSLNAQSSNMAQVDSSYANAGHKTRPANMKILYIIRVY